MYPLQTSAQRAIVAHCTAHVIELNYSGAQICVSSRLESLDDGHRSIDAGNRYGRNNRGRGESRV